MSDAHPDWWSIVNLVLVEHESRIARLERMIDLDDTEYVWPPGELESPSAPAAQRYDLRTGPERADARMDDHQQRIATLEQRIAHMERMLHRLINHADKSTDNLQ